jgi:hypothetical protein
MKTEILANATVTKLREYRQKYGAPEIVPVPYIVVYEKQIQLLTETGHLRRTMKRGTRLLVEFNGQPITQRAFDMRIKKAKAAAEIQRQISIIEQQKRLKELREIAEKQATAWHEYLKQNPQKVDKYKAKIAAMSSAKGRNYVRLKAANKINAGSFNGLAATAHDLLKVLNSL